MGSLLLSGVLIVLLANHSRFLRSLTGEVVTIAILFPALVFIGASIRVRRELVPLCVFLGTASYPLYILHYPMVHLLSFAPSLAFANAHPKPARALMLAYAALLMAASYVLALHFDAPVRKRLTAFARNRIPEDPESESVIAGQ